MRSYESTLQPMRDGLMLRGALPNDQAAAPPVVASGGITPRRPSLHIERNYSLHEVGELPQAKSGVTRDDVPQPAKMTVPVDHQDALV